MERDEAPSSKAQCNLQTTPAQHAVQDGEGAEEEDNSEGQPPDPGGGTGQTAGNLKEPVWSLPSFSDMPRSAVAVAAEDVQYDPYQPDFELFDNHSSHIRTVLHGETRDKETVPDAEYRKGAVAHTPSNQQVLQDLQKGLRKYNHQQRDAAVLRSSVQQMRKEQKYLHEDITNHLSSFLDTHRSTSAPGGPLTLDKIANLLTGIEKITNSLGPLEDQCERLELDLGMKELNLQRQSATIQENIELLGVNDQASIESDPASDGGTSIFEYEPQHPYMHAENIILLSASDVAIEEYTRQDRQSLMVKAADQPNSQATQLLAEQIELPPSLSSDSDKAIVPSLSRSNEASSLHSPSPELPILYDLEAETKHASQGYTSDFPALLDPIHFLPEPMDTSGDIPVQVDRGRIVDDDTLAPRSVLSHSSNPRFQSDYPFETITNPISVFKNPAERLGVFADDSLEHISQDNLYATHKRVNTWLLGKLRSLRLDQSLYSDIFNNTRGVTAARPSFDSVEFQRNWDNDDAAKPFHRT